MAIASLRRLSLLMKLFFVVLLAVLATGFISFMTLSLNQVVLRHPGTFAKPSTNTGAQAQH